MPIDPLTLSLAASGGGALVQGLADLLGNRRTDYDAYLEEELRRLQGIRDRRDFGLDPAELAAARASYRDPLEARVQQERADAERAAAATGQMGGAAVDAARRRAGETLGRGVATAEANLGATNASLVRQDRQRNTQDLSNVESAIEQRRTDRRQQGIDSAAQAVQAGAQLAGSVPGLLQSAGLGGTARSAPPTASQAYTNRLVSKGIISAEQAAQFEADPGALAQFIRSGRGIPVTPGSEAAQRAANNPTVARPILGVPEPLPGVVAGFPAPSLLSPELAALLAFTPGVY